MASCAWAGDPATAFGDASEAGRAIHRPGEALTPLGRAVSAASLLAAYLSAFALIGLAGGVLVTPDQAFYWNPRPDGDRRPEAYRRYFEKERLSARYRERVSTPEQDERVRAAYEAAGLPPPKFPAKQ